MKGHALAFAALALAAACGGATASGPGSAATPSASTESSSVSSDDDVAAPPPGCPGPDCNPSPQQLCTHAVALARRIDPQEVRDGGAKAMSECLEGATRDRAKNNARYRCESSCVMGGADSKQEIERCVSACWR